MGYKQFFNTDAIIHAFRFIKFQYLFKTEGQQYIDYMKWAYRRIMKARVDDNQSVSITFS